MGDPKLIESIKASLSRGRSKEEVYRGLLDQGWTVEAIQEGFRSAEAGDAKEDARRKTIRSLVTMGALLVGAGVFSFIAANWEGMTKPVKVDARSQRSVSNVEALAIILLVVLFAVIPLLPSQRLFIQSGGGRSFQVDLTGAGVWWAILFNVLVFVQLLGLIFSGYARREGWLINVGALFLFLLIAVKYFDWFFAFLDKSVFFVGAGILLLAVGWLMEKGRRYVISSIDASSGRGI